jgi:hypothetical protein
METVRTLWTGKLNDGLWHFIGSIYEEELHQLNCVGFQSYQEAIDIRNKFGYKEFKTD